MGAEQRWLAAACMSSLLACGGSGGAGGADGGDAGEPRDARAADGSTDAPADVTGDPASDGGSRECGGRACREPPPPPPWDAPLELADEVGWRDSTEPLCNPYAGQIAGLDMWADSEGVYVLETIFNDGFDRGPPYRSGTALNVNDGTGWKVWYSAPTEPGSGGQYRVKTAPDGTAWLWPGACPVRRVSGVEETACAYSGALRPGFMHMLDRSTGYFFSGGVDFAFLDSGEATVVSSLDRAEADVALWADADGFLHLTQTNLYRGSTTAAVAAVEGVPEGDYAALWVNRRDDVWITTAEGSLLHYDGSTWERIVTGVSAIHLWADSDVVYFADIRRFGRWTAAGGVEILLDLTDDRYSHIGAMHGNAEADEVYLLIDDFEYEEYACGRAFAVWYDGEVFRRF